jgi:hypothetical protein
MVVRPDTIRLRTPTNVADPSKGRSVSEPTAPAPLNVEIINIDICRAYDLIDTILKNIIDFELEMLIK